MKQTIFALVSIVLLSTSGYGQDAFSPFQLSLFGLKDLSESPLAADTVDSLPEVQTLPRGQSAAPDPTTEFAAILAEPSVTETVTQAEISRLNRPVGQIRLSGLVESTPALSGMDASEVSQSGFMDGPGRLMTASGLDASIEPKTVTTYSRRRLYFEDKALERQGKSGGHLHVGIWTNGRSAAKFLIDTALLPYRMIKGHPNELVHAVAE